MKRHWHVVAHLPAFDFSGGALKAHWTRLHAGDCEPFPTEAALAQRIDAENPSSSEGDIVEAVQQAWRAFHAGDFQQAFDAGSAAGLPGFVVALKAAGIYASEVERRSHDIEELLSDASNRAKEVTELLPKDPNAHYLHAFTLGRYSQRVSIATALAEGLAGKIEKSLEATLKLEPKHADAHIAFGVYHSEIVGKLGSIAARLTYGASSEKAVEHFKKALKLEPHAPIVKIEYAQALQRVDASAHADEIEKLLTDAAECEPADAVEWLDRERAKRLLKQ